MSNANSASTAVPLTNNINMTTAISSIEDQQDTLSRMVSSLDAILYGAAIEESKNGKENVPEGFEARLTQMVTNNERLLCKLDRIISRL